MSNIPVSTIVNVSISIGTEFPSRAGFGVLNLITLETGVISLAERIRTYNNIDGVTADWPADSEVVAAATAYFSQQPKPTVLKVSTRYESAQSAELRGASVVDNATNVAALNLINDGSFTVSIDGSTHTAVTGLDFTGVASMAAAAVIIQAGIRALATGGYTNAICVYEGGRFFVRSAVAGVASMIDFLRDHTAGTGISDLLGLVQGEGSKTDGIAGETITASLNNINNIDDDWYGYMFTKEVRDGAVINGEPAVIAAAAWAEARVKVFGNTSNNLDVLDSVSTTHIAKILEQAGYNRTITTFSSYINQYPSASLLGRAFTVNFSQPDSTITLKFKQLPGITVENLTQNQKAALDATNANALINVGGSVLFSESVMANGRFFDEVHGVDWLENAIQTEVFGYLLTRSTKVPYTNKGVAALEQQVIKALAEAVRNGLLAPGETIDGEFLPNGYETSTLDVSDVDQSNVEARNYPGVSFIAIGAGAIHGAEIQGVFER